MLETLTPEQKQRLEDNMKAWKQLTPEQRQSLREKDGLVRKKFLEEAIEASASLPEERREAFQKQYVEERRKLEASLRQDLEARRKHGIEEILRKLNVPSPPPTPASADPSLPASR
jgi:DNA-directed RNA polymerase specialized sigma24 family protein